MYKLKVLLIAIVNDPKVEINLPPDDDTHGLHELLNIIDLTVNTNDYKIPVKQVEPTCSVVEVHQADPEETIIQNIPEIEVKKDENEIKL